MLKIYVNSLKVFVQPNTTILEACETVGIEIPRFCYYEKLSIAGNCRMCLVEIEKSPKPVVSCSMPVMGGMKIFTDTPLVKKAREGVLEFLLLNHPLDCPICDQGGECDLQDQSVTFGTDRSRFYDFKRSTEDKNVGPILKTIMTRCIHCTRCVRFASEIAGVGDLGTTARGTHTEIGTYIEKVFQSELSGNVVDLCPVGALTSKPYAFIARPWELKTVDSIDISDAIGSNIRIDYKETEIVRVLPRLNEEINEEWISNKTRFMYDGLKNQRLIRPYIKSINTLIASNWVDSLAIIKIVMESKIFYSPYIVGVCGVNNDLETLLSFKTFIHSLGSESVGFERNLIASNTYSFNYQFNSNITQIEHSDFCLLIGVNPRYEGSMLNVRLRKRFLEGGFIIASVGAAMNLTYPVIHIGLGITQLHNTFFSSNITSLGKAFFESKSPVIIFGSSILERTDSLNLQNLFYSLNSKVSSINLLQMESNQTGAFELGLNKLVDNIEDLSINTNAQIIYLLGIDHYTAKNLLKLSRVNHTVIKNCFIIYQGSNGTSLVNNADVVLPSSTFTEKKGAFMNTEGRVQKTFQVLAAPGLSKDDWEIFKALAKVVNVTLKFNHFQELQNMVKTLIPAVNSINQVNESNPLFIYVVKSLDIIDVVVKRFHYSNEGCFSASNKYLHPRLKRVSYSNNINAYNRLFQRGEIYEKSFKKSRLQPVLEDFYLTSSVMRASHTLVNCSTSLRKDTNNFITLN